MPTFQARPLRTWMGAALLAGLATSAQPPAPASPPSSPAATLPVLEQETYRIEGRVESLSDLAKTIEAWDACDLELLSLAVGAPSPNTGERPFRARLALEDLAPLVEATRMVDGLQLVSIRPEAAAAAKLPAQVGATYSNLSFQDLRFLGPDGSSRPVHDHASGSHKKTPGSSTLDGSAGGAEPLPVIPAKVGKLHGQPVKLEGYMIPLTFEGDGVIEFLLLPQLTECCADSAPGFDEFVLVKTAPGQAAEYSLNHPLVVLGKLGVHPAGADPSNKEETQPVYQIIDATTATRD